MVGLNNLLAVLEGKVAKEAEGAAIEAHKRRELGGVQFFVCP